MAATGTSVTEGLDFSALLVLANAGKPSDVDSILVDTFRYRHELLTPTKREQWKNAVKIDSQQIDKLANALRQLIRAVLFESCETREAVAALFPADFHGALKQLISKLILSHSGEWRDLLMSQSVGAPKLIDFDWRVDVKQSSNVLSRMSVPTILVNMRLQQQPTSMAELSGIEHVKFELSATALQTMLSGLETIREQLAGMQ